MEAAAISFSSPFNPCNSSLPSSRRSLILSINPKPPKDLIFASNSRNSLRLPPPLAVAEAMEQAVDASGSTPRGNPSKVDRSGRFCSPRAARELALLIAYAACLEGSDPVRLFDRRVNAKRDPGYVFDKSSLLRYDHMSFGGAPVEAGTEEEASELMLKNEKDSANEAEVLSAPPKVVYNRFVLRLTRDILGAVVDRWNQHVLVIDKIIPQNWKDEPAGRILELCILHIAMAEITVIGTRHQIVINEAVDLAKRFCDGCAPRIINGCLRTFVKDQNTTNNNALQALQSS
ncbi:NusB antitermination factor protein [Dioscorea alata]|uniref:NusB antitermination factor protein n=1 Tax=Dioscorea alata TaxID=55571 RepID=A0ACB7VM94_DIOAL|nr:NusB antitermination factor protein [Dioscorea alata]